MCDFKDAEKKVKKFCRPFLTVLREYIFLTFFVITIIFVALVLMAIATGGWDGLTAVGTIALAFSVFALEIIVPYVKRPEMIVAFDEQDKKCCREAQIVRTQPQERKEDSDNGIEESPNSDIGPSGLYPNGIEITDFPMATGYPQPGTLDIDSMASSVGSTSTNFQGGQFREAETKKPKLTTKEGYFIRIRVKNIGKTLARKCQGVIQDITIIKGDERQIEYFVPLVLHWTNRSPRLFLDPIDLNAEAYWYLDVAYTEKDSDFLHIFHIFNGEPIGTVVKLTPGEYKFKIVIYAEGAEPIEKCLVIKWQGKNYKDIKAKLE